MSNVKVIGIDFSISSKQNPNFIFGGSPFVLYENSKYSAKVDTLDKSKISREERDLLFISRLTREINNEVNMFNQVSFNFFDAYNVNQILLKVGTVTNNQYYLVSRYGNISILDESVLKNIRSDNEKIEGHYWAWLTDNRL